MTASPLRQFRGWMNRHTPYMITCGELESFLVDFLDGTLPPATTRRFRLHLWLCADCRAYVRSYEATIALGQTAFDDPNDQPAGNVPEDLLRAVILSRGQDPHR